MTVEGSNFRVMIRKLQDLNKSNLTICMLQVTGKVFAHIVPLYLYTYCITQLSATDISLMIESATGSAYRLIIYSYPQLLATLYVTRKISSVIVPASLQTEKQHQTQKYSVPLLQSLTDFPLKSEHFQMHSDLSIFEATNAQSLEWKKQAVAWRTAKFSGSNVDRHCFCIIVTSDIELVHSYYAKITDRYHHSIKV